jgi:hypothetical protein
LVAEGAVMSAAPWNDPPGFNPDEGGGGSNGALPKHRFPPVRFDDIELTTSARCVVEDLIPRESVVVVWGPPKCAKSFFVFDMVMHVALGREYRDKRVEQGTVVYIAAEGEVGIKQRVAAFRVARMHPGESPQFYLLATRIDLVADVDVLAVDIRAQLGEERPAVIVVDTLNRTFRGSENKDEDMGAYRDAADRLREGFGCTVIIIHHCGVSGDRPRGHTSLTGAVDAQLAVRRDADKSVLVTLEHMKDGPEGDMMRLALQVVEVGLDDYGKPITSCVIEHLDAPSPSERTKLQKLSAAQVTALKLLHEALIADGKVPPFCNHIPADKLCVREELWREYCYAGGISGGETQDAKEKAFKRAAKVLLAFGRIGAWEGWVWIP